MKKTLLLLSLLTTTSGCMEHQLNQRTMRLSTTTTDLIYMQVLDNIARTEDNPAEMPYFNMPASGTAQIQQQLSATVTPGWGLVTSTAAILTGAFPFNVLTAAINPMQIDQESWQVSPVPDPDRLSLMHAAYLKVTKHDSPEVETMLGQYYANRDDWVNIGIRQTVFSNAVWELWHEMVAIEFQALSKLASPSPVSVALFKLNDQSFTDLRNAKVPEALLTKLKHLKDKELSQEDLQRAIAKILTPEETIQFQDIIFKNAVGVPSLTESEQKYIFAYLRSNSGLYENKDVMLDAFWKAPATHIADISLWYAALLTIRLKDDPYYQRLRANYAILVPPQQSASGATPVRASPGASGASGGGGGGASGAGGKPPLPIYVPYFTFIKPGWYTVGKKKDVPKDACFVGHHCDTYVWVCPHQMDALNKFSLAILDFYNVQNSGGSNMPNPPPATLGR
jgi:hypothetical protein